MSEITKKGDGPLTEERAHTLRKQMKGRRYCMDEETEIIFLASLEDIKKNQ
jgi:CHAD domain-containing protein